MTGKIEISTMSDSARDALLAALGARPVKTHHAMPPAISAAWRLTAWKPTTITVDWSGELPSVDVGITPAALFALYSTALSSPTFTLYVATTGNDSTGNGTSGAPYASIWKAIQAGNALGTPGKVIVAGGEYTKNNGFSSSGTVYPTVDMAFVANGRVRTGTFDGFSSSTTDATNTRCYVIATANVNRVFDRSRTDSFGNWIEYTNVGSAAICNDTPGSWYHNGTTLYIHRHDGAAITTANTRIYRSGSASIYLRAGVNVYVGGVNAGDGFDIEGGSSLGCIDARVSAVPAAQKIIVGDGATFKYAGGIVDTGARGIAAESWHGAAIFFNCRADANWSDGANAHNTTTPAVSMTFGTINCSAWDNGRGASQSNNPYTLHEDVLGFCFGGWHRNNRGNFRNINQSICWAVANVEENDMGDIAQAGGLPPTAYRADDTAVIYVDTPVIRMPAGGLAFYTTATASIRYRNLPRQRIGSVGLGTISAY